MKYVQSALVLALGLPAAYLFVKYLLRPAYSRTSHRAVRAFDRVYLKVVEAVIYAFVVATSLVIALR